MCATSLSKIARASIDPIGTMKLAHRNTKSGSTSSAARNCSRRPLRTSARRRPGAARRPGEAAAATVATIRLRVPRRALDALLRDPGVEALVQLVEILEPELVVDR